ncbi:unnamed protein product [Cuscuta campestris]|uniref:TFIIS N-terminal domain-containing protein n=1 Tax=Cuscuta campestris TaxID=132261 RepID=A0A484N4V9_9ASTE|nr:unnamed protein product [Cuscuta campestris]
MRATTKRTVAACDSSLTEAITADSFCKEDRKICVGDCALFKPPHDSPPFIGIIRCLIPSEDKNLQLGVNWLYRPAELKLGKGILLEAEPNEIFYSFHWDEISAASLLHPCKVAFLPKGVELPTGVSSFVCRRVYDIANKCLCWLTDQDYIDELQEEVDQLLHKTRVEMHASLQPGGRSPKPINGPMSTSQSKTVSENGQNTVTSFPSQVKGKKRERGDDSISVKRERSFKQDDCNSNSLYRTESAIKSEIAKVTERGGGLVDSEGVDKLVQLMQSDRGERKMDLVCRSLLAAVIASTDKFECLNQFVQLRGLLVLDEWLQDIHKGNRNGDGNPKDGGDKQADELLVVLLRALDKLPVNLEALKMCNIGKSVNHLRSHKNMDIQRKARSLVDTWKKRVEIEMNMIDANKPTQGVAWPSKSRLPETSHSGNKNNPGCSNDVTPKSSVTQLSSRATSLKTLQVETAAKSASSSPVLGKEGQARVSLCGGPADVVPVVVREDKSSSSSQSHNHSPSFSGKEDARSSTAGSMSSSKISNNGSRHRKPINGFPGASISGIHKERNSASLHNKTSNPEKLSQSAVGDKSNDFSTVEGRDHKLIVKIPNNRGRSPAQSASGGSCEEPNIENSRASSPVVSEKHDHSDQIVKAKSDAYRSNNVMSDVNAESWQSNDFKDILTGSDEGDGSPAALPEDDDRKAGDVPKISSSFGTELKKSGDNHDAFNSMNALIESCIKYSEANASMSVGDAGGMNLLASVATEEMSKSDMYSPSLSSQRNSPAVEETSIAADDLRPKPQPLERIANDCGQKNDNLNFDNKQHGDAKSVGERNLEMNEASGERSNSVLLSPASGAGKAYESESDKRSFEEGKKAFSTDGLSDAKPGTNTLLTGHNASLSDQKGTGEEVKLAAAATVDTEVNERPVMKEQPTTFSKDMNADKCGDEDKIHPYLNRCGKKMHLDIPDPLLEDKNSVAVDSIVNNNPMTECNATHAVAKHDSGHVVEKKHKGSRESDKSSHPVSNGETCHVPETASKMKFDLNEGFASDDGKCSDAISTPVAVGGYPTGVHVINPLSFPVPASITVAAPAKGPFVPPEELLRFKGERGEFGWKGSAATSAFRPAEPRRMHDTPLTSISSSRSTDAPSTCKPSRPFLDIDLNAPGECCLEDEAGYSAPVEIISCISNQKKEEPSSPSVRSSGGGLDLDLNRVDEPSDVGQCSLRSAGHNILQGPIELPKQLQPPGRLSREVRMDFDLNNGPGVDDVTVEHSLFQPNSRGSIRMNNPEMGNFASWFTPVCSYSAVTVPSAMSDRGGPPPQPPSQQISPFPPDLYRGSVLSSSPAAVPFPSAAAASYQIPMFPFGTTNFPLPSTSFPVGSTPYINSSSGGRLYAPSVNSQLLGSVGAASSPHQFPRPYMVALPDNGTGNNLKWAKQGLDLNAGPGTIDLINGGRDESILSRQQLSLNDQQVLLAADEQHALYHPAAAGSIMKRKEPDGGWGDNDSFRYSKQSLWQ